MTKKTIGVIVTVLILGVVYYFVSPLFIKINIDEVSPLQQNTESNLEMRKLVATSSVVGTAGHGASGEVSLLEVEGKQTVRYENFNTINGPDLYVYLSKDLEAGDFIDLGEIKGTSGNINYPVPDNIDISEYKYVLTWCKQFGVLFNYAELKPVLEPVEVMDKMDKQDMSMDSEDDVNSIDKSIKIEKTDVPMPVVIREALLANGCFWCAEADLTKVKGVINVVSGYAGGSTDNPDYKNYTSGGHREVVEVTYDANQVTFGNLIEHIIKHGDPTDTGGSFGDRGEAYVPAIYYDNEEEKVEAYRVIKAIDALKVFSKPLPLAVIPKVTFWPAEEYHQDYAEKNPIRYNFYRSGSGRNTFIKKYWGDNASEFVVANKNMNQINKDMSFNENSWSNYIKPTEADLKVQLTSMQFKVSQQDGTEPSFSNIYDKNYEEGIYVDIVSGEPLFLSKDKYDSGTGWPSFVKPIYDSAVTLHEDKKLFSTRTEVRSTKADSHLGHVFNDGPKDRGGLRYCMNSASMRFVAKDDMAKMGYEYLLPLI